jgi:hypothetical protein
MLEVRCVVAAAGLPVWRRQALEKQVGARRNLALRIDTRIAPPSLDPAV